MRIAEVVLTGSRAHVRRSPRSGDTAAVKVKELSLEMQPNETGTIVVVTGRATVDSSPDLRAVLHDAIGGARSAVTIDFSSTSYLDTSAVATLLEAATVASRRHVALRVIGLHGDARVVAESTELDRILPALGHEVQFA